MIPEDDSELGQSRLLEVDNRVVVPAKTYIRIIVTSADVLHSWAVPSLGVKCDAVPGRSNQTSILVQREGVYYGQCSEIRGTNHGFMPIVVEAVPRKDYGSWVSNLLIGEEAPGAKAPMTKAITKESCFCAMTHLIRAVHGTANEGHLAAVEYLLQMGANPEIPNDSNASPLHHVAMRGRLHSN
ncbi:hypothetical protein MKW94_029528 [Papaver nudicaule]|uniref:cytochrome-c oxidase n=1 Tax=Papaver nudicaule TaxID=74823 RepID=A0AA41VKB3_PAPNU|nr:hypothetical protein [Papaver nudicaule]